MNFLSVAFDDMNAYAFLKTLYGGALHTPNIDRVMAMGTTFENGFSQVAVCNASRTAVLTGLDPGVSGVHMNYDRWAEMVDPGATLPALLRDAGYNTSLIGKVFHDETTSDLVLDAISDFHFRAPESSYESSTVLTTRPLAGPVEEQGDHINVSQAIDLLNSAGPDPFAMFLGIAKPHLGWVVPQEYFDLYPVDEIELPFNIEGDLSDVPAFMKALVFDQTHEQVVDANAWKTALQGYFASISFADAMLGRVLDTLEANGQLDTTAILLWTDHGYHLGDKDNWHKFTLWEEAARAPVIVALPGSGDDGQRVEQVVELVDIMPTMLDLLGIDAPAGLSGRSLVPFIQDPTLADEGYAVTTMYGSAAIRTNGYRYILYEDGSTELYDIVQDPNQWTNLAGDPAWQDIEEQLDGRLRADLEPQGWLWADAGATALGTAGNDVLVLAPGTDTARGGAGDDVYFINDTSVRLVEAAGRGTDTVYVSDSYTLPDNIENVQLRYRARNETLVGNALDNDMVGAGRLEGLEGNDRLELRGAGSADGGAGNDLVEGVGGADRLAGGEGNDLIIARGGNDLVGGGAGDDRINGGDGIDTASYVAAASGVVVRLAIAGAQDTRGAGTDTLAGFENVTGSAFADRLAGDGGANLLTGGAGSDKLDGGRGTDIMNGGAGDDLFVVRDAGDGVIETANGGSDEVGSFVNYRLADNVEALRLYGAARNATGNDLANSITGTSGHNGLVGLGGNDLLRGGAGTDQLRGGDGNDRLDGGAGTDSMLGGAGADRFVFEGSHVTGLRDEADSIGDFSRAQHDRIDLRAIDADAGTGGDQNFEFLGTGAFSGAVGELRVGASETGRYVEGDVDGDKIADFFIQVSGTQPLVATDFIL